MQMSLKFLLAIAVGGICALTFAQESKQEGSQPVPPPKARRPGSTVRTSPQSIAAAPRSPAVNTNDYNPSTDTNEMAACRKNLEKINAAIEAYRKENQDVPNWLSDLLPKYLKETQVLICPVTTRTGLQSAFGVLDPKIHSSYLYEFTPTYIPEVVKGAWPGPKMTMREWKQQQMKLAGSKVPLVRCLLHEPALNLSIGGTVYQSPVFWELNFTNSATKLEDFSPH
jgi:hypothetical protein